MKFDWNDISIVPAILSDISSRNEVDTRNKDNKLPLFTAPMDMVISAANVDKFYNSGLNITLPRHIKYDELKNDNYFYSYGLDEIIDILDNKVKLPPKVLIDIANGNMRKLYDTSKRIKEVYGDNIELMIGNIANPETYRMFCDIGVDYCRVSVGSGSACFVGDTIVNTKNGNKKISNIENGDFVLTHTGVYKEVINTIQYNTTENLININDTISTNDHKYYVIDTKYIDKVTDDNIHKYAIWISAEDLDPENHLLVEVNDA